MKLKLLYITLIASIFISACGGVTETGNPNPLPQEPESGYGGGGQRYTDSTSGVEIPYPSSWTLSESSSSIPANGDVGDIASETQLTFSDQRTIETRVLITITHYINPPTSIEQYLANSFPGRSFTVYQTATLSGYKYDDPAAGSHDGDLIEYYFMSGTTIISIEAEVQTYGLAEWNTIVGGI